MRRSPHRRQTLAAVIGLTLLVVGLVLADAALDAFNPLEVLELGAQDFAFALRGTRPPDSPIVVVAVDDLSINYTGLQWPWPRTYLAAIVDRLAQAGARVIGIDVLLIERDPDPAGDPALADALRRAGNVVLVGRILETRTPAGDESRSVEMPVPELRDASLGFGLTGFEADADSAFRRIHAFDEYGDEMHLHWAFHVASHFTGSPLPGDLRQTALRFDDQTVPLEREYLLINYRGPAGTFPTYPAVQVELGDYPDETFRDKIVLVGATTESLHDTYPTPFRAGGLPTPGVEVVANAVDTILTGDFLRRTPAALTLILTLVAGLAALLVHRHPRPTAGLAMMLAILLGYGVVWFLAFRQARVWLPLVPVELNLVLCFVVPAVGRAVAEEREKRRVRGIFERFISPQMVEQLIERGLEGAQGKRADLTILFSDIRGFTSMSERLGPEELVAILNEYLEAMTDVIHKHGGTVDKYEGDAIVAFFGAPLPYDDHPLRAVRAALEMRTVLDGLRQKWTAGAGPKTFEIGIGLNSGEVFVGLIGSAKRVNYTVIGDNANLAARLQDLTKQYGWPILMSEATHERVKDGFDAEFVESVQVKGKRVPVNVYRLLGQKGAPEGERVRPLFE